MELIEGSCTSLLPSLFGDFLSLLFVLLIPSGNMRSCECELCDIYCECLSVHSAPFEFHLPKSLLRPDHVLGNELFLLVINCSTVGNSGIIGAKIGFALLTDGRNHCMSMWPSASRITELSNRSI